MELYLVGGAVRDRLLGLPVKDRDWVVVGATPQQLLDAGYKQVGRDFPVFLHPDSGEEYALARTERKQGVGYGGFVCHASPDISLEDDLLRRDLTINAMASDAEGQLLIDPYGGQRDLQERWLRHVSPAFVEDPLRVLRVARFAARYSRLGFRVAPETLQLMQQLVASGELQHLTAERVWQESERALGEAEPWTYIAVLRACGALAVLFPEVDRLFGVPQTPHYHPEIDTGAHVLLCLQAAVRLGLNTRERFAVLLHDLGKGLTPPEHWPRHIGHESSGLPLVQALCQRYRVPRDYQQLAEMVCAYHLDCHRIVELRADTLLKKLQALDALRRPERFEEFLRACTADAQGRLGSEQQAYPQADYFRAARAVAAAVTPATLGSDAPQGAALGEALLQARRQALHHFRHDYTRHQADTGDCP